jgi:hypothetical protein
MTKRRVLGVGVLVTVVAVVLVAAVVGWGLLELDRHFDEGLLGPGDRRQQVEVPEHGFAISLADDWTTEIPLPDPQEDERLGMHALLTIDPGEEGAACSVYVAIGAAPPESRGDGERSDGGVLSDSAARTLGPWFEAHGLLFDEGTSGVTVGDLWGGKAGFSFGESAGLIGAVWVVPHEEDLYVLTCTWTAGPEGESGPEPWDSPHLLMLALEPLAESFEFLPLASPEPTPRAPGHGGRVVAVDPGVALTFPDGWTVVKPGSGDHELALALARLPPGPMRSQLRSSDPAGVRLSSRERGEPVESCTLDDVLSLPGWLGSWDDATIESIVALVFPVMGESDRSAVTYLDLPAGRAARIDSPDGESHWSAYVLPHHKTIHMLVCEGPERPGEDWDSIARSIELLPIEE